MLISSSHFTASLLLNSSHPPPTPHICTPSLCPLSYIYTQWLSLLAWSSWPTKHTWVWPNSFPLFSDSGTFPWTDRPALWWTSKERGGRGRKECCAMVNKLEWVKSLLVLEAKTKIAKVDVVINQKKNVILIILSTLNELYYFLLGVVVADRLVTDGTQQLGHLQ